VTFTLTPRGSDARSLFETDNASTPSVIWYETASVCALASVERHLGHIVVTAEGCAAYDGTHTNSAGNGFRELGVFRDMVEAKAAVEEALGFRGRLSEGRSATPPLTM
jgi:hypothetical protein